MALALCPKRGYSSSVRVYLSHVSVDAVGIRLGGEHVRRDSVGGRYDGRLAISEIDRELVDSAFKSSQSCL